MAPAPPWTPKSLLAWSEGYFASKGISTPRLDCELLLAHVLGVARLDLYLQFDRPLQPEELAAYRELVTQRAQRVPVAYLLGEAGFWNLTLAVAPGCLVPRPETEVLVEVVVEAVDALRVRAGEPDLPLTLVELGTGTAAIPLAVCSERTGLRWICLERSAEALAVAGENLARHSALLAPRENSVRLVRSDGFDGLTAGFHPQLMVSNPPYVPTARVGTLEPEVSRSEPRAALDGGPDGLDFHRLLFTHAARMLPLEGRLICEMGGDQGDALRALAAEHAALRLLEVRADNAGKERVVHAEARETSKQDPAPGDPDIP